MSAGWVVLIAAVSGGFIAAIGVGRNIAAMMATHKVAPLADGSPACPCHPYPGRAIYRPEWGDKCRSDCWIRDPDWPSKYP